MYQAAGIIMEAVDLEVTSLEVLSSLAASSLILFGIGSGRADNKQELDITCNHGGLDGRFTQIVLANLQEKCDRANDANVSTSCLHVLCAMNE